MQVLIINGTWFFLCYNKIRANNEILYNQKFVKRKNALSSREFFFVVVILVAESVIIHITSKCWRHLNDHLNDFIACYYVIIKIIYVYSSEELPTINYHIKCM